MSRSPRHPWRGSAPRVSPRIAAPAGVDLVNPPPGYRVSAGADRLSHSRRSKPFPGAEDRRAGPEPSRSLYSSKRAGAASYSETPEPPSQSPSAQGPWRASPQKEARPFAIPPSARLAERQRRAESGAARGLSPTLAAAVAPLVDPRRRRASRRLR